jgi:hypothetical protein
MSTIAIICIPMEDESSELVLARQHTCCACAVALAAGHFSLRLCLRAPLVARKYTFYFLLG